MAEPRSKSERSDDPEEDRPAKRPCLDDSSNSSNSSHWDDLSDELDYLNEPSDPPKEVETPEVSTCPLPDLPKEVEDPAKSALNLQLAVAASSRNYALVKDCLSRGANADTKDPRTGEPLLFTICRFRPISSQLRGSIDLIELFIEHGASVNFKTYIGVTPLHVASFPAAVEILLKNGASVNNRDSRNHSPLSTAIKFRRSDVIVEALLKAGALKEEQESATATCMNSLHWVNKLSTTKLLLEYGANVNGIDGEGETPLFRLCRKPLSPTDMIDALLNHGATVNFKARNGRTPLHAACAEDVAKTVEFLLQKGAAVDEVDRDGESPLFKTAKKMGNADHIIQLLLAHGASVNLKNSYGRTPLHECRDSAAILLNNGASANAMDNSGETPIFSACRPSRRWDDNAPLLLKYGASVNLENNKGDTPLLVACRNSAEPIVRLLLQNGAHVNYANRDGETPLFAAIRGGRATTDLIEMLLDNGAFIDWINYKGQTPLHVACFKLRTHQNALTLLKKGAEADTFDDDGESPLFVACRLKNHDVATELLNRGCSAKARNARGLTLFHVLTNRSYWDPELADLLIKNGATVNGADNSGTTPLFSCLSNFRSAASISYLLNNGAAVNHKNNEGKTPLHVACDKASLRKVVPELLQHGASVNEVDREGREPMDLIKRNYSVCDHLLGYGAPHCANGSKLCLNTTDCRFAIFHVQILAHAAKARTVLGVEDEHTRRVGQDIISRYQTELAKMMQTYIGDTDVSCHDLLTLNIKAEHYDDVLSNVTPGLLENLTPSYADMTYCQYLKIKKRRLMDQCSGFFSLSSLPRLPPEVAYKIFEHLTITDITSLLQV